MCGIVAAVAERNIVPVLIEGLRKLEYRGYDSWGLAAIKEGKLIYHKRVGKIGGFDLKKDLGISKETFVFLTIGRLISQKGVDILIRAMEGVSPEAELIIVGQGPFEAELKKLSINLGLEKRVHFLGIRHDIPEVLSICDCFVLASRYEGLGIVVLEAMASKKPIIISSFEAGKDMIVNEESGLVVEIGSHESLMGAMNRVVSDGGLRERLAEKAHEKVEEFSIEKHVSKILDL